MGVLAVSLNFPKSIYNLKDVIEGSIKFSLVKLRIKSMSLTIIRKEVLGSGLNSKTNEETLSNYEIMDGCPAKMESIPVRFFLPCCDSLGPTMKNINNKFSITYHLNLLIIDEENQKYFKSNEITLFRKGKGSKSS